MQIKFLVGNVLFHLNYQYNSRDNYIYRMPLKNDAIIKPQVRLNIFNINTFLNKSNTFFSRLET